MMGFQDLKDKSKLNIQPDRIQIRKVSKAGTLKQVLNRFKVPDDKLAEIALLNGKELNSRIESKTLVKTVARGR